MATHFVDSVAPRTRASLDHHELILKSDKWRQPGDLTPEEVESEYRDNSQVIAA